MPDSKDSRKPFEQRLTISDAGLHLIRKGTHLYIQYEDEEPIEIDIEDGLLTFMHTGEVAAFSLVLCKEYHED